MLYNLIKYEHTESGLMLLNSPKNLITIPADIVSADYNPLSIRKLRNHSEEHGLTIKFNSRHYLYDWKPKVLIQETSDIGHLVEITNLTEENNWQALSRLESFLHLKVEKDELKFYGFSIEKYKI